jgi:hypothetical protein
MNAPKLVIDDKKFLNRFQMGFGILMISFSLFRFFFESPTTATIMMSIAFSIQGISMLFLGSNFRKTIFERDGDLLKIRWGHTFSKKSFSDNWIKEILVGDSYLFIKPINGDVYKHRIDPLKPESRDSLLEFLRDQYPERIKTRQRKT